MHKIMSKLGMLHGLTWRLVESFLPALLAAALRASLVLTRL